MNLTSRPLASLVTPSRAGDRVTTLELFFDLVFVFAFTQVTGLMAHGETPASVLQGLLVLSLLWWAWCCFTWLANQARANRGMLQGAFVVAMVAMFLATLAIPEAYHDLPGGLYAPGVLVFCYAVVRIAHLAAYYVAAGDDAALRRQVLLTLVTSVLPTVALLATGAVLGGDPQLWIWLAAVLYDFAAIFLGTRGGGWVVNSPEHFAERHGLVTILALGESIVAIGVGLAHEPVSWSTATGAVLAIAVAVCLWWLYFRHGLEELESSLYGLERTKQAERAAELFTYGHFPVIAGVIVGALGIEQAMAHLEDDHLGALGGWALAAGIAVVLVASSAILHRATGRWAAARLGGTAVLLALGIPLTFAPPLVALGTVVAVLVAVCATEAFLRGRTPAAG
ncbi:low temperature requirement protein A [Myceligenerans crystallogenes]|uniref:Low temperature requirement protein A n=1 Tax=Myceligenerans crystallogenes TaxID=316335 RepID=A0ABN2N8G1_9MICO